MQVKLRDYQEQSVYLLNRSLNAKKHPLCVLPTGAGKSLVIAGLLKQRQERVLVLSHVAELLEQDSAALERYAPEISQTFFVAGLEKKLRKRKNAGGQVVFGSVQSVCRNLERFKSMRKMIVIDEAHLCPRSADAMYARVFDYFGNAQRVGFTATALRLDSGSLVDGDDAWFDHIAHEVPVGELIEKGYLLPLSGIITELQADLDAVTMRGGEFAQEEAQQAVMRTLSLEGAVQQACTLAARRKSWLVFAAGVEHATQLTRQFQANGIDAATVVADTEDAERAERIAAFRAGELRCLVNVGVLTTGFDAPRLDCIISMRPTQSPVLWQQMLGRGMRVADHKKDCLLLDFVGNLERLGGAGVVIDVRDQRLPAALLERDERRAANVRRKARKQPEYFDASGRDPMLSGDVFDALVKQTRYFMIPSRKQPGKRILVASYELEDQFGRVLNANTFLCVEYAGSARYLATAWFSKRGVVPAEVPADAMTAQALAYVSPQPAEVSVRHDARRACYVIERERFDASP